jgi:hypothetical protein
MAFVVSIFSLFFYCSLRTDRRAPRLEICGQIPPNLEVRSVSLDTRLNVDIPPELGGNLTCDKVKELCIRVLEKVPEWSAVMEKEMLECRGLQLAWRLGTILDWIWLEQDAEGKRRDGAILVGSALMQVRIYAFVSAAEF